ncbi:SIR2 family protein [Mycobacterium sp. AT1]|uniref:SIR2 family protein n=1 Tax=Mycobacterium sp. AT1 TaxID=1961706 RepID=UPI0009C79EF2|nr:SIR2 family protein [Mycobacterium sp. AT1]OPX05193.1 hypothetical protein B1790_33240 [Mycobacterium sp. AT1]
MSTIADDDAFVTVAFSLQSNPGAYAVLVGAGVSQGAVPTAWEVLTSLIVDVAHLKGAEVAADEAERWWADAFGTEATYENVLESLAPTQHERQRLLRGFFENAPEAVGPNGEGAIRPNSAHRCIARLVKLGVVRVILTTNFDHLLEEAVRDELIQPTVIAGDADVLGMAPLHTLDCCIIHLHGDYLYPETMLNTVTELNEYKPAVAGLLNDVLGQYGLLVSGWSARYDKALRGAIAAQASRRYTMVWMEPFDLSQEAQQLTTNQKALVMRSSADEGFGELTEAVESLQIRRARQPLAMPAAVETAKRELSGRWTAIRLHDTLNKEFDRSSDTVDLPDYRNAADYGGLAALVASTEEHSQILAALLAVMAYWGDEGTDDWWVDEIGRLSAQPRASGLVALLKVRLIASSFLFYAAGVAAVAKKRYGLLARLLALERPDPSWGDTRQPLAEILSAASSYEETSDAPHRHYGKVTAVLREALRFSDSKLQDLWQRFEVIRLAHNIQRALLFHTNLPVFLEQQSLLDESLDRYPDLGNTGDVDPLEIRRDREAFSREWGFALNRMAEGMLVQPLWPHVLGRDTHAPIATWRCDIAQQLFDEISAQGDDHPLVIAGIGPDGETLAAAVRAVSHAIGRRARESSMRPSGIQPEEVWADTGRAPYEMLN